MLSQYFNLRMEAVLSKMLVPEDCYLNFRDREKFNYVFNIKLKDWLLFNGPLYFAWPSEVTGIGHLHVSLLPFQRISLYLSSLYPFCLHERWW
jgi:hypothetical protein